MATERIYYTINETMARAAQDANSFSDYEEGSATAEYRNYVDKVYDIVDKIEVQRPHLYERAVNKAERYSRKLAEYYNDYYRNEASCPSILISGGGNFPVGKKNKQNSRRDTLRETWNYLSGYAKGIEHLLTMEQPILSNDENAVELLEEKLESLVDKQERMKAVNAYYRKNRTLDGCEELTERQRKAIEANWERGWYVGIPFASYELSNNNANIKRIRDRVEKLKQEKSRESSEQDYSALGFTLKENTEEMRIQLFFDGKPEAEVRDILKGKAFKWSPRNGCWQRQLTDNARYATKQAIEEIRKLQNGSEG